MNRIYGRVAIVIVIVSLCVSENERSGKILQLCKIS